MSELHRLQVLHTKLTALLLTHAISLGFEVAWGEALRTKLQAEAYSESGLGISSSLHILGLAIDLKLFKDGRYLTDSKDYEPLGTYWKSLDPLCCWGGDFKDKDGNPKPDGDHFSITYQGVK